MATKETKHKDVASSLVKDFIAKEDTTPLQTNDKGTVKPVIEKIVTEKLTVEVNTTIMTNARIFVAKKKASEKMNLRTLVESALSEYLSKHNND